MKPVRCAIYGRVSCDEQDPEAQLHEVRDYVARRGWQAEEYIDHGVSGRKDSRPQLDRLRQDIRRGRVDVVVCYKLDRIGRTLSGLVKFLDECRELGVDFVSTTQAIDTTTAAGRAMLGLLSVFSEFEVETLRERVRSGIAKARAAGRAIGRPKVAFDRDLVLQLRNQGKSYREIAKVTGVSKTVIVRFLSERSDNVVVPTAS